MYFKIQTNFFLSNTTLCRINLSNWLHRLKKLIIVVLFLLLFSIFSTQHTTQIMIHLNMWKNSQIQLLNTIDWWVSILEICCISYWINLSCPWPQDITVLYWIQYLDRPEIWWKFSSVISWKKIVNYWVNSSKCYTFIF